MADMVDGVVGGVVFDEAQIGRFVRRAIELAGEARRSGNPPFGSLLVAADGGILAEERNSARTDDDVSAHPELKLAVWAARHLDADARAATTLVTSTENCPMCTGGLVLAGLGQLLYSVSSARLREFRGEHQPHPYLDVSSRELLGRSSRPITVRGPVLEEEGLAVHEGFWG